MKLQLFIAHNGGVSRRGAFEHILAGDVTVNGTVIREPSQMIDQNEDKVMLLGREIRLKGYEYIMLNKPTGYVTTCEAQFDQRAVMSLLPAELRHLKPVGRLDKDTQGLLILTNDGEMANRLAHPSYDVNKTYHVRVVRRMEFREKDRLEQGVVIEGFKTAPAQVANIQFDGGFTEFDLTIHEGHKHQVRLMCHEVGHDVVKLTRIAQGPLQLDLVKPGAWRNLTGEEVAQLKMIGRKAVKDVRNFRSMKPLFSSHSQQRRNTSQRDWHSADTKVERPRSEGAPRREYKPYNRDERPRSEGAPRREYKPYNRDERPREERGRSSDSRSAGRKPFGRKPFGSRPSGKKFFGRSSAGSRTSSRPQ